MSRKLKEKLRQEKKARREREQSKKKSYHDMAKKGELGEKYLEKYTSMYENLPKEKRNGFKKPNNHPTMEDYNGLRKVFYSNNVQNTSLENRTLNDRDYNPWRH